MKGKPAQALKYVTKEETRMTMDQWTAFCATIDADPGTGPGPYEFGTLPKGQGERTDLQGFTDALASGETLATVAMEQPTVFVRYHAGFQKLAFYLGAKKAREFRKCTVKLYWGATGVGKTRHVIREANLLPGDYFLLQKDDGKTMWWDGYEGQEILIMDELRGHWMRYSNLLTVLDGNQQRLPVKCSFTHALWNTVLITSSTSYKDWYVRDEYSELERRLTEVIHMEREQPLLLRGAARGGPRAFGPRPEVGVISNPTSSGFGLKSSSPAAQPVNDFSIWNGAGLQPNLTTAETLPAYESDEEWLEKLKPSTSTWTVVGSDDEESFLMSD